MANEYAVNSADLLSVADAIREKGGTENPLSFPAGFVSAIQAISGGGASLGLIAVSSADSLPETANANTIAVVTEQTIGKLYVMATAPDAAIDGDVLIMTASPEKNIMLAEDGTIELGIAGAYIKTAGAWSFVDTYVFTDGAWSFLWSDQLFYNSNGYTDYTGGWVNVAKKAASNSSASAGAPDITYENGSMVFDTKSTASGGMYYTANQIDLTPYKTVVFEGTFERSSDVVRNFTAAVWSSVGTYYTSNMITYTYSPSTSFSVIEVDVSEVNEVAHVGIGITNSKAIITKCYLVPKGM